MAERLFGMEEVQVRFLEWAFLLGDRPSGPPRFAAATDAPKGIRLRLRLRPPMNAPLALPPRQHGLFWLINHFTEWSKHDPLHGTECQL
jgi:hypothetical protein